MICAAALLALFLHSTCFCNATLGAHPSFAYLNNNKPDMPSHPDACPPPALAPTHSAITKPSPAPCSAFTLGTTYIAEVDIVLPEQMHLKEAHDIGEAGRQAGGLLGRAGL